MGYKPSDKLLSVYADLLVNMALNSGEGVEPGEVVQCLVPDLAKPMYGALQRAPAQRGADVYARSGPKAQLKREGGSRIVPSPASSGPPTHPRKGPSCGERLVSLSAISAKEIHRGFS